MAAGIKAIPIDGCSLIFPRAEGQPLLDEGKQPTLAEKLIPNLPNLFVVRVPTEKAEDIAEKVKQTMQNEWEQIAKSVWKKVSSALGFHENEELKTRFDAQVSRHLKVSWKVTAIKGQDYGKAYRDDGWHLDAVRQLRYFDAWGGGTWKIGTEKDSLTGKEEALCGGPVFADAMKENGGEIPSLFKHDDHIGAITLIGDFAHSVKSTTEISNHNRISAETGTVEDGALFNLECVPAETLFMASVYFSGKKQATVKQNPRQKPRFTLRIPLRLFPILSPINHCSSSAVLPPPVAGFAQFHLSDFMKNLEQIRAHSSSVSRILALPYCPHTGSMPGVLPIPSLPEPWCVGKKSSATSSEPSSGRGIEMPGNLDLPS